MNKITALLASFFCLFLVLGNAQEEVTIPGTQVRYVQSKIIDQKYKLVINLPANYEGLNKDLPVLYLMDAQWDFPLVSALYGEQYYDGFIPEMIVVGVTWGGEGDNPDVLRRRDYTPTAVGNNPVGGGANTFLDVLGKEIFPYVEKEFKADPMDRALCGSSLGGLFTLHALFKRSDLFKRYFLTSPAIGWDNYVLYQEEEEYSKENHTLDKYVYMAHGEMEGGVGNFNLFVDKLKSRKYQHLTIGHTILEGVGHSGTKPSGYTKGLQHIFRQPEIAISAEKMTLMEGSYEAENGRKITLAAQRGRIYAKNGFNSQALKAVSPSKLIREGGFYKIELKYSEEGAVTGLDLHQYGGVTHFDKGAEETP